MIMSVPIYTSLLKTDVDGVSATLSLLAVYGAIEVFSHGRLGKCVASNSVIAETVGVDTETVRKYIRKMNNAGWIKIVYNDESRVDRKYILPLLEVSFPNGKIEKKDDHESVFDNTDKNEICQEIVEEEVSDGVGCVSQVGCVSRGGGMCIPGGGMCIPPLPILYNNLNNNLSNKQNEILGEEKVTKKSNPVNDILGLFQEAFLTPMFGNPYQRDSAKKLIDLYGFDKVKEMAEFSIANSGKEYAPVVSNPTQLLTKWHNIEIFKLKKEGEEKLSSPPDCNEKPRVDENGHDNYYDYYYRKWGLDLDEVNKRNKF